MKIDQHDAPNRVGEKPPVAPTASGRRVSGSVGRQGSRPAAPPPKDNLDLSAGAEEFQRLRSRLDGLADPTREARVAELQERIARDTYVVAAGRVAEAMLRDETVIRQLA